MGTVLDRGDEKRVYSVMGVAMGRPDGIEVVRSLTKDTPTTRVLKATTVQVFLAALVVALLVASFLSPFNSSNTVQYSLWSFTLLSGFAIIPLRRRAFSAEFILRRPHWVQFLMHSTVFVYWGYHYSEVLRQVPFILAQVAMAYILDILLSWWRRGRWVAGLGPIPVIGSINLFLWFRPEFWHWQVVMVLIAMGSKPFLRWTRDGKSTHIFNPSAIALGFVSLCVLILGGDATKSMTWGVDIATTLNRPEHIYVCLFAVGVVVQYLFKTTLTTASAALALWGFCFLWALDPLGAATSLDGVLVSSFGIAPSNGLIFRQTYIPIAVFLGMNLLITDPSTSPYSKSGRILFGMSYGLAVVLLWWWLESIGQPTFYDKLLQVPVLNLLVPVFDRIGRRLEAVWSRETLLGHNVLHLGVWTSAFTLMLPTLKPQGFAEAHQALMTRVLGEDVVDTTAYTAKRTLNRAQQSLITGYKFLDGHDGTPQSVRQASVAFNDSCETANSQFSGEACYRLGELYLDGRLDPSGAEQPNLQAATSQFKKACDLEYGPACGHLGTMHMAGDGVPKDPREGSRLLKRGCDLGVEAACTLVGRADAPDSEDAACDRGNAQACYRLAGAAFNAQNFTQAAFYAEKACLGGLSEMCGNAGGLYLEGKGVPRDVARAKGFFQKACNGGIQRACEFVRSLP